MLFDSNLSFDSHISCICKTAFIHLKNVYLNCVCVCVRARACACVCVSHRITAFLLTIYFMVCPSGTAPLSQSQFNMPYTSQYLPSHSQNITMLFKNATLSEVHETSGISDNGTAPIDQETFLKLLHNFCRLILMFLFSFVHIRCYR